MQFSSGSSVNIGVFDSCMLVGKESSKQNIAVLTTFLPQYLGLFQPVSKRWVPTKVAVCLDVQFMNDDRKEAFEFRVSVVVIKRTTEDVVEKTNIEPSNLRSVAECTFAFTDDLKTFSDEPVNHRHVYTCRKEVLVNVMFEKYDRVALFLKHSNVALHALVVSGYMI